MHFDVAEIAEPATTVRFQKLCIAVGFLWLWFESIQKLLGFVINILESEFFECARVALGGFLKLPR